MAAAKRSVRGLMAGGATLVFLVGCGGGGPTTRGDLCDAYHHYEEEAARPHILSNKGEFDALKDLGDTAERYRDDASVREAGAALKKMGESNSYPPMEAEMRAAPIRSECETG